MPNTGSVSTIPTIMGRSHAKDNMHAMAESFTTTAKNIMNECQCDFYRNLPEVIEDKRGLNTLRKFFTNESFYVDEKMDPEEIAYEQAQVDLLFENDITQIKESIGESAMQGLNTINPLIGMTLPMHKNIMMNMVWDKGGIPKQTAPAHMFSRQMEIRELVMPDGKRIDFFTQQNQLTAAMLSVNPEVVVELLNGEAYGTEIVAAKLDGSEMIDNLDVNTYISAVKIEDVYYEVGDILPGEDGFVPVSGGVAATESTKGKKDTWFPVNFKYAPGIGQLKLQLQYPFNAVVKMEKSGEPGVAELVTISDVVTSNIKDNRFFVVTGGKIAAVQVTTKLDASQRTIDTPSVEWREESDIVKIDTDSGISCRVAPELVKDMANMYNVNYVNKSMSMMKTVLSNRKDDKIKMGMDSSYKRLPAAERFQGTFDFAVRDGYYSDHVEWRGKTFWDYMESQVTQLIRRLNDPNVTVSIYGEPDIIRKLSPKTYTYQVPASIGPVELDFAKTVVTSDKRVYSMVGSDKCRNDYNLIITLSPRNSDRIIYVIYDYQFYLSNEIRNNANPALPQITAFERWKFDEYQPVQGRIKIANPSGFRPSDNTETKIF